MQDSAYFVLEKGRFNLLLSVLSNAFSGQGLDLMSVIASILASLLVIFVMLPFHEFAHATVAGWFGDKTAKMLGRQTLNPLKHIDYVGAFLLLLVGFGWAKPVPVNLDHRKIQRVQWRLLLWQVHLLICLRVL